RRSWLQAGRKQGKKEKSMSMPRGLRGVGGVLFDLWPFGKAEPPLMIDMKRVNVELRKEALAELAEDVVYRERVKQRIREGKGCAHPPLVDRKRVLQFAAAAREARLSAE